MKCENVFCIYEEKGKCILDNISIDVSGACTDCIYIDIDEEVIRTLKNEKLHVES